MDLQVGDVIVLPFVKHQENDSGETRWCIITEILQDEFEFVPLTKQVKQKKHYKETILIKKKSIEGKQMGLKHNSLVILDRKGEQRLKLSWFNIKEIKKGTCPIDILTKIIKS